MSPPQAMFSWPSVSPKVAAEFPLLMPLAFALLNDTIVSYSSSIFSTTASTTLENIAKVEPVQVKLWDMRVRARCGNIRRVKDEKGRREWARKEGLRWDSWASKK